MESEQIGIFKSIYEKLKQAAQDSQVATGLLANAMIVFLCEELQHPKSAGLRLKLQQIALDYENQILSEALDQGSIIMASDEDAAPKTP